MFKCTECNKEYDTKPYYCDDCGNDTFEEVVIQEKEQSANPEEISQYEEKRDFTPIKEETKPEDILSYIIFGFCLFLSIVVIFFINPKFDEKPAVPKKEENVNLKIPSIDSFWNNELPKTEQIENKREEIKEQPKQEVRQEQKTAVVPLKFEPIKKVQNNVLPAKQPVNQVKQQPVQNTKSQNTKTQQKPQQTTSSKAQTQPQKQPQNTTSNTKNNNIQVPVWQQTQPAQPVQTQQTQPAPQKTTTVKSSQSLTDYKNSLRNKIGRTIDFADVIGDGSCAISFRVASSGKLTDRKFVKQSTNSTLNDAVYKAIMQVPAFNAPPESYGGETMQLNIKFYNGNFEISLK